MNADADFVELQTKRVQGLLSIDDELGLYPGAQRERLEAICARLVAWAGGAWPLSLDEKRRFAWRAGAGPFTKDRWIPPTFSPRRTW